MGWVGLGVEYISDGVKSKFTDAPYCSVTNLLGLQIIDISDNVSTPVLAVLSPPLQSAPVRKYESVKSEKRKCEHVKV